MMDLTKGHYVVSNGTRITLDRQRLKAAIVSGKVVSNPCGLRVPTDKGVAKVVLFRGDSFSAAQWVLDHDATSKPLVLDFASDSNPGGGWRGKQQGTQEEELCRNSSLGLSLEHVHAHVVEYMPRLGCVYVPDCVVVRNHLGENLANPFWVSVVAGALRPDDVDDTSFVQRKIQGLLQIARAYQHTELVLGAWGCGAFGNDPETLARAFATEIQHFRGRVVFALCTATAFKAFQKVFQSSKQIKP